VIVMRVVHPSIAAMVALVPRTVGWVLIGVLYTVYAADLVATTVIAKGLARDLDALEDVAEGIHAVSDAMTQVIGSKAMESDQKLGEGKLQLKLAAAEARSAAAEKLSSRESAARAHELAQSAKQAARRAGEAARQSAAGAASAARQAAVGTAERAKETVVQQLDLEELKTEADHPPARRCGRICCAPIRCSARAACCAPSRR